MNPLLHWLTAPEWAHVVAALLHSLWEGAIVALTLAVLMRRLTHPLARYRCTLSALGVIVIAGILTWAILNAPQSAPPPNQAAILESIPAPLAADAPDSSPADNVVVIGQMTRPEAPTHWTAWLALTWMAGAMVMLLRAGVKVAGAEKLRRSCRPLADEHLAMLVAEACRAVGLARKIRVAVTDQLTSPAVVGVLVPTLILPLSLFTTLTPTQIQFVLLHELAHIRRGDYLTNLFQLFAEALLFFNPAVWWVSHQIRREREACCDAPAAASAFGDDGREPSSLADRVQRLLVPGYRPALRLTWRAMATSLLVGGALLVLSALGTRNTVGAILTSNQPAPTPTVQSNTTPIAASPTGQAHNPPASHAQTNAPTSEPLYTRTFNVDLNKFYAAVRNSAGLTETVNETNLFPSVRSLFANAGVNIDPATGRSFFLSTTRGDLLVRATLPELNSIEALLKPLQGTPVFSRDFQLSPQALAKTKRVLPPAINLIVATNPATGFRALLESFDPNDPRPKYVYYKPESEKLTARATESDLAKLDSILGTLQPTKLATTEPTGLQPEPGSSNGPKLTTRTFQVEPGTIAKAIEAHAPQFKPVTATNVTEGLRALLQSSGADLSPPKSIYYNDRAGGLFVHATKEDLDAIESLLQVIGRQPIQVNIKAVFVEIPFGKAQPKELAKILETITPANGTNFTGILTAQQFKNILGTLENSSAAKILAIPQVTTLSGRQAQLQVADVKTIISGMTTMVTNGMTKRTYQTQAMPFGPVLDVLPTVSSDGYTIQMTLTPTFTEFLGYEDAKKLKLSPPDDKATLPLPIIRTRQITTSASVWDGQTIVLGNFSDQMLDDTPDLKGSPKTSGKKQSKQLLVFVTPMIIDQVGNPANKDMGIPSRLIY